MSPQVDPGELRRRFAAALEAAARAHESGNLPAIEAEYERLDGCLPRTADAIFGQLQIALEFWDGWIDARNHEWQYYAGIEAEDWPFLARTIVDDLRNGRDISDERVLERFDFRRRVAHRSLWRRIRGFFGVGPRA